MSRNARRSPEEIAAALADILKMSDGEQAVTRRIRHAAGHELERGAVLGGRVKRLESLAPPFDPLDSTNV